jgi:hypothetical protein
MSWKFWQKEKRGENVSGTREIKLATPRELPDRVGIHLVVKLKENPDRVWNLKCAMRPKTGEKHAFEVRIFDPADAAQRGVTIRNFNSLDDHPDMILFFGWFSKETGIVKIEKSLQKAA